MCLIASCLTAESIFPDSLLLRRQVFTEGEYIFREGNVPGNVYTVQSGTVKSYINGNSGEEQVVTFRTRGDLLGLAALAAGVHTASTVALDVVSVCGIPMTQLDTRDNRFPGWLYRLLARELVRDRVTLRMLRCKNARSRLAAFLLDLAGRLRIRGQSRQVFSLSMSRQDIGNHLGMTIETLCRALSSLRKARLIDIDHRRVTIRDFDGLHALAQR